MGLLRNLQVLTGKKSIAPKIQQKKVLIVEDEKPLLHILSEKFTNEGYAVFQASNGQEGLAIATSKKPQIVILDLLMPVMDGKTMLWKLREIPEFKTLPVIVLTNAGEVENIRETQTFNNAASFLIKSNVTMSEIVERVKLLIGEAQS